MAINKPLNKMSTEEKLQVMESTWEDLRKPTDGVPSPSWHKEALERREAAVSQGTDEFVDWERAKKDIKKHTS